MDQKFTSQIIAQKADLNGKHLRASSGACSPDVQITARANKARDYPRGQLYYLTSCTIYGTIPKG